MTGTQQPDGMRIGVILKGLGGLYYAMDNTGEVSVLRAKGKFRKQHISPIVGDQIWYTAGHQDEHGWIEEILPRKNALIRPPVANIDTMIYVLAPVPEPDMALCDQMLLCAFRAGIRPVLVMNKCELDTSGLINRLQSDYRGLAMPILAVSAKTGAGLSELDERLKTGVCCFAGQSGVGKSTLLSRLTGLALETGEISKKISRGKNTTRCAQLLIKDDYRVLDTAGFSLLEAEEGMEPITLQDYYPEFVPYEGQCRFQPCYHLSEPGCAVIAAAKDGQISQARLDRYHELLQKVQKRWKERYE